MSEFEIVEGENGLMNVLGVPMIEAGIEFKTSSGPFTPTPEDLADFVESQDDPSIQAPRNFIGHPDDDRPGFRPLSGEPALGVYKNIRLSENGMVVYGDIIGVPAWLAEILPTAYPNRSGEWQINYKTHAGKTWRLACNPGVALLGIIWPGIETLDDLPIVFSADGPEGVEVIDQEEETVTASAGAVLAQVNVEDVNRIYYDEIATEQSGRYWWLIRAIYLEPNELVVEDFDTGQLYKFAFSISGEAVTFGDPEAVKIEYVPDTGAETASTEAMAIAAMSQVGNGRIPAFVNASRAKTRPDQNKEGLMSKFTDAVRSKLRLASDASEEEVLAAIPEVAEDEPQVEDPAAVKPVGEPEAEAEPKAEAELPVAAASDTVQVDRATWDQVKAGAESGAQLKADADKARQAAAIKAAVAEGKIPPARTEHYASLMAADEEGTTALLASLEAGVIPVDERGTSKTDAAAGSGDLNALFPQLSAKDGE